MAMRQSNLIGVAMAIRHAARHYTLWGKLHKGNRSREFIGRRCQTHEEARHQKNEFKKYKFQTVTGSAHAYNAGDEAAGPRQSNPEPAERTHL